MEAKYLQFWNKFGDTYKSKDGKYEAIKSRKGSYKVYKSNSDIIIGIFCDDDTLNDYLGYVRSGSCNVSVGAKGYGNFNQ